MPTQSLCFNYMYSFASSCDCFRKLSAPFAISPSDNCGFGFGNSVFFQQKIVRVIGQLSSPIRSARSGMSSSVSLDFIFLFLFLSSRFFLENRSSSYGVEQSKNELELELESAGLVTYQKIELFGPTKDTFFSCGNTSWQASVSTVF